MSKKQWIWSIIVAVILAGAGFWGGMTYAQSQTPSAASRFAGTSGTFTARGGAGAFAGGTIGTVIQVGNGSFTVQLPTSTSTTATTGTKLVLVDTSTQVQELQSVPISNLQVGQTVTVAGSANSDGSITATSVMIRPAGVRGTNVASQTGAQ
ncbi:MAG TPA: DUF5666 domain-containing protein [Candidatus Paceibacterota bacterium]|jgi:hypothetical protein|nr:DUF5666 domain-containing protein [Candidatus Paceibacterota bacterium]